MVEYTDPNLFKEFHIGHLMSNADRRIHFSLAAIFWCGSGSGQITREMSDPMSPKLFEFANIGTQHCQYS